MDEPSSSSTSGSLMRCWSNTTEQQIAVAFGQGEVDVDQAVAAALMPLRQPTAAAEHRPRKAAKVNTSWDSCITEQGSSADSSSPTILSFGGHAAAFAKAEVHQVPSAPYYGHGAPPAKAPKQEVMDAGATPFNQDRPQPALHRPLEDRPRSPGLKKMDKGRQCSATRSST